MCVGGELECDAAAWSDSEALGYVRASGHQVRYCRKHRDRCRVCVAICLRSVFWNVLYLRKLGFDDYRSNYLVRRLQVVGFRR